MAFKYAKSVKENPLQNHIRVITISGNTSQSDIEKLKNIGAEDCLDKPINVPVLLKQLAIN